MATNLLVRNYCKNEETITQLGNGNIVCSSINCDGLDEERFEIERRTGRFIKKPQEGVQRVPFLKDSLVLNQVEKMTNNIGVMLSEEDRAYYR